MKNRNGFVSNSSSSSFVILKDFLSEEQKNKIIDYVDEVVNIIHKNPDLEDSLEYAEWGWGIKEIDDFIFGETSMDNFDMSFFLNYIGVDEENICWGDGWVDSPDKYLLEFINRERRKVRKKKLEKLDNDE